MASEAGVRLEAQDLGFAYDERQVLAEIDLTAEPGEAVVAS